MLVAAVVVMAAVMVVNVVVGIVKWLSGCLWLPVVVWVESCPCGPCSVDFHLPVIYFQETVQTPA